MAECVDDCLLGREGTHDVELSLLLLDLISAMLQRNINFFNLEKLVLIPFFYNDLWNNAIELERTHAEFVNRLATLANATFKSNKERAVRLNEYCGHPPLPDLLKLFNILMVAEAANTQTKFILECGEAYIEEARNIIQIMLLTRAELWSWTDRFYKAWLELTNSFAFPASDSSV